MPTRGFAGQIMFFTNGDPSPVKVNGDVRIFCFDDFGTTEEQSKPLHQFDYDTNVWNMHLQKSMLGPSYQVFVPYVRKDHHAAKCALSLRLKPAAGPTIYSKLVSIALPGLEREKSAQDENSMTKAGEAHPKPGARKTSAETPVESAARLQANTKAAKPMPPQATQSAANEQLDALVQQLVVKSNNLAAAARARTPEPTQIQTMTNDAAPSHPLALNPASSTSTPDRNQWPRKVIVESAENFQNASAEAVDTNVNLVQFAEDVAIEPVLVELPEAAEAEPVPK
jgi:hypothetical protein